MQKRGRMKALGMYIFGGSQTIGHMLEGWEVDTVLEMTDEMIENNAYHFSKNYPNINIKLPKEYEDNKEYLDSLKKENYDLLFSNPPCSGLSQINRNANVNNDVNKYIYKVIDMVKTIEPKIFFIENAPTLVSTGLPILKDISKKLVDDYYLLIMNDCAKNHNVSMHRRRTFVIGFNKKIFSGVPYIEMNAGKYTSAQDVLNGVDYTYNKEFVDGAKTELFKYYKYVKPGSSIYLTFADNKQLDNELSENLLRSIEKIREKQKNGESIWDKSSWRTPPDCRYPSLTSLTELIHPTEDRDLYVREYAAIMGYPNDFIFYQDKSNTPVVQCIAQGVPVNFIRYISRELMNSFNANRFISGDIVYINQTNPSNRKIYTYSLDKFISTDKIDNNENMFTCKQVLW